MAMFTRETFHRAYANRIPYIDDYIGPERWKDPSLIWSSLFNVKSSKRMTEQIPTFAGLGLFEDMIENGSVNYDNMVQGPYKSYTHVQYGLGYQIGWMAAQQDLDGFSKKYATHLKRSLRMSLETLGASFFDGTFATYTTADGEYVCDTDHKYVRGAGEFSNKTTAALGHTALETALVAFMNQKDLQGLPQPQNPSKILCKPDLAPMLHELLQSPMRHDTTTHAKSYVFGKVAPVIWPFLSSSTAWWILGDKKNTEINWYWNAKPQTSHGFHFDSHTAKTKVLFICSFGASDPRAIYGSTGA
jgi:hypothetical protein